MSACFGSDIERNHRNVDEWTLGFVTLKPFGVTLNFA